MLKYIFIILTISISISHAETLTVAAAASPTKSNVPYKVEIEIGSYDIKSTILELENILKRLKTCNLCKEELGSGGWSNGTLSGYSNVKVTKPSSPPLNDSEIEKLRELLKVK